MKLRRVFPLVIAFVFVPAALMLTVGILILVYGSYARDYVFGGLILALVTTTIAGTAATLAVLSREAKVARLQTDFVNKVSHDLRTPLTSIRMFVETLQLGRLQDPAKQNEALEIIRRLPLPTQSGFTNNFATTGVAEFNRTNIDIKINYDAGSKLTIFGRYSRSPTLIVEYGGPEVLNQMVHLIDDMSNVVVYGRDLCRCDQVRPEFANPDIHQDG